MVKKHFAHEASNATRSTFDLPAPPVDRAVHASPLDVPPPGIEIQSRRRVPLLILGNAAVLSAGIIAAALLIRSERSKAMESARAGEVRRADLTGAAPRPLRTSAAPATRVAASTPMEATSAVGTPAPAAPRTGSVVARPLEPAPALARRPHTKAARPTTSTTKTTTKTTTTAATTTEQSKTRSAARDAADLDRTAPREAATTQTRPARASVNPWQLSKPRGHRFPRVSYRPSRAQVIHAMRRVAPAVYACFEPGRGFAMVRMEFSGKTGRMKSARVLGQHGPQASCVSRAVRPARLPKFLKPTLKIDFPFKR